MVPPSVVRTERRVRHCLCYRIAMKTPSIVIAVLVVLGLGAVLFFRTMGESERPPTPMSAGKLDINVVCEGALAYMTFPDTKAADTFVADCKEGKHPEVIERYKADHGFGDGAQI